MTSNRHGECSVGVATHKCDVDKMLGADEYGW